MHFQLLFQEKVENNERDYKVEYQNYLNVFIGINYVVAGFFF